MAVFHSRSAVVIATLVRAGSTVAEVKGSHAVYVSQPQAVASIITKAAHGVALATR